MVTSDGNGNPDRTAIVLLLVEESRVVKTKEYDVTVIIDIAALVRALLRLRTLRLSRSHLIGVPKVFWQALHLAIALLGVVTALGKQVPYVLRYTGACLGPELVVDRDSGQVKMEIRGISAALRQGRSGCLPGECLFVASTALRQTLRGRPTRRLGSIAATLAALSTPSQSNAFCLVLFGSEGELVLAICLNHDPAHDPTRSVIWYLMLGWIQAGWIRSQVVTFPDGIFSRAPRRRSPEAPVVRVARGQKLLQNTSFVTRIF